MMRLIQIFNPLIIVSLIFLAHSSAYAQHQSASMINLPLEAEYSRYVNIRPGDGVTVKLNPPRFSWFYSPNAVKKLAAGESLGGDNKFILQISSVPDFKNPKINIATDYNFYNTLPVLDGSNHWYWRVGYKVGNKDNHWSPIYNFYIAPDAVRWDRSALALPALENLGHPRILFNKNNLAAIRELKNHNADSLKIFKSMQVKANKIMAADWWQNFPKSDLVVAEKPFFEIAHDLTLVAFLWTITNDPKYLTVKSRAVALASFPKGGKASPENIGGDSRKFSTQVNEFLALLFDWLYPVLTEAERKIFISSLEWRADYIMHEFAWKRPSDKQEPRVSGSSLATCCGSHEWEGSFQTSAIGLALYEHSPIGKSWYDLFVNYLIGVTNQFGAEEGWNEGPGYGTAKLKWLINSTIYFDTTLNAQFHLNPLYSSLGDFFSRITPIGLKHSPWGNGSARSDYYERNRIAAFRKLAFFTGNGVFLSNWKETGGHLKKTHHPWIEYVLPHYYQKPVEKLETKTLALYPTAGWAIAATHPPSLRSAFNDAVGIIFQARPQGGYSHSFHSDGSFQIYAYGEDLNYGGGSTENRDMFAYHSMSHTGILIDGLGQVQTSRGQLYPAYSKIIAFREENSYVYFAGDMTLAYPRRPDNYTLYRMPLPMVYRTRDASHLKRWVRHVLFIRGKYFVVFDDLQASKPSTWTWLYHILPETPFNLNQQEGTVDYAIGKVNVRLLHAINRENLAWEDRKGINSLINPITKEDYRSLRKDGPLPAHNLWVSTKKPTTTFNYLVGIFPQKQSDPLPSVEEISNTGIRVRWNGFDDSINFTPPLNQKDHYAVEVNLRGGSDIENTTMSTVKPNIVPESKPNG